MINLRNKAMLKRKGKCFLGEYALYITGTKQYRHLSLKRLSNNWKRYFY